MGHRQVTGRGRREYLGGSRSFSRPRATWPTCSPGEATVHLSKAREKRHVTSVLTTLPLAPMKPSDPTHWGSYTGHPAHLKCTPGPSVRAPHTPCWWLQWLRALPHQLRPLKHPSRLRPLQVACKEAAKMLGVLESPSHG